MYGAIATASLITLLKDRRCKMDLKEMVAPLKRDLLGILRSANAQIRLFIHPGWSASLELVNWPMIFNMK